MFFFAASFFSASYSADGILMFNALSFTFSPPLQFYYNYCRVSTVIFHNLSLLFLLVLPSLQSKKVQKSPKDWVFRQQVTELQTNIFKKIALHFAPFMI